MNVVEANRKHIEDALAYSGGTHKFDDVKRMIYEGKLQIWPAPRGCAVTEVVEYPQKRVLHIFLAAGDLEQFDDMLESAVAWAKSAGCVGITLSGRFGWQRVLKKHGFKPIQVVMEKPI